MNINETVKVKLTEHGVDVYLGFHNMAFLPKRHHITRDGFKAKADSEGWHSFQLWHLMEVFGPHIHLTANQFFENNNIMFPL